MTPADLEMVGFVVKAHGIKGELKIAFEIVPKLKKITSLKKIFLGQKHDRVPFFTEKIQPLDGGHFILKVEGCQTRNDAEELAGKKIFVSKKDLKQFFETSLTGHHQLIDFMAVDSNGEDLGKIEELFDLPQQTLAQINFHGKEILIPLNNETILQINKRKKTIVLQLPEGLLNL